MPQTRIVRIDGEALADIRCRRGLTIVALAGKIGRHRQTINQLETGRKATASAVVAHQLANALGVDVSAFTLADDESSSEAAPEPNGAAA
jgi:transcriptional regulator with XRE-family HTH domain